MDFLCVLFSFYAASDTKNTYLLLECVCVCVCMEEEREEKPVESLRLRQLEFN
jgi:hypothetical protein